MLCFRTKFEVIWIHGYEYSNFRMQGSSIRIKQ